MMARSLLRLGLCWIVSLVAAGVPAWSSADPVTLRLEALIDGRSEVIVAGDTVRWHHVDDAAPGRHEFRDEPTILNGISWWPDWPDVPDAENRDCGCDSSEFEGLTPAWPRASGQVTVRLLEGRWQPRVLESPAAINGYALRLEFDDRGFTGSAWYRVEVVFVPEVCAFDAFVLEGLRATFGGSGPSTDGFTIAARLKTSSACGGIDPAADDVYVAIGGAALMIPAGCFHRDGDRYVCERELEGARVVAAMQPAGDGWLQLALRVASTDLHFIDDPTRVILRIGDDEGMAVGSVHGTLRGGSGTSVGP